MVRVEPLRPGDYGRLVARIDSPEDPLLWGGTPFSYPLTADQLRDHYEGRSARSVAGGSVASRTAGRSGASSSTESTASTARRRSRE